MNNYWKNRVLALENANNSTARNYVKDVSRVYDSAIRELDGQLHNWYSRFATTEGITLTEAKRILSTRELEAFRMDVHEYIKKGQSLDPKWRKQLEQASVRVHVSRLEALKVQTQQIAERMKGEIADSFDEFAIKTYSDQYYKTIFEIQKGSGIGFDIMKLDEKQLRKVINKPWAVDGKNFSKRIWDDRTKLVGELHQTLGKGIIQGLSPDKLSSELAKRMGVSKSNSERLIYTESAFFANQATIDSYKELDVEKYEILATLDTRTTPICRKMDGKTFDLKDVEVGVNYPPFHVRCRTTTVPFFDDEFTKIEERAARNEKGEYYTVPASMKYKDWFTKFVEGGSKEGLEVVDAANALLKINEACDLFKKYGDENYRAMHDALIKSGDEDLIKIWAQNEANFKVENINSAKAHFSPSYEGISLNLKKDLVGSDWEKPLQTSFHELGHNLDYLLGGKDKYHYYSSTYKEGLFAKTVREEIENRINDIHKKLKTEFEKSENKLEWLVDKKFLTKSSWDYIEIIRWGKLPKYNKKYSYQVFEDELRSIDRISRSAISDITEGVTSCRVQAGFGHGKKYWKTFNQRIEKEAFAEMIECVVNPEQWEVLKRYLPKSTTIFKEMIKDAIK